MKTNFSLPGNPNEFMDRKTATWYLVDCCLNVEETEWVACSVQRNPKPAGLAAVAECAVLSLVKADAKMLLEVYETVLAEAF
jgi:hypothetical protein